MTSGQGHWTSDPDYPVEDWRYEVMCDSTRLGYKDWVKAKRELDKELSPPTMVLRECASCNAVNFKEGFVIGDGELYFCSEECLNEHYSEEEWHRIYSEGNGYWTQWEDDE